MLGINSLSFLILTLIGAVVAVAYHDIVRYRFLEGRDAFFGKVIVGWLGAWLGSPVLGHWLWKIEGVYVVPAILGAIATIHMSTLLWKAFAKLAGIGLVVREEKKKEEFGPAKPTRAA